MLIELNLRQLEDLTSFTYKTLKKKLVDVKPSKIENRGNFYSLKDVLPYLYQNKEDGSLDLSEERARLAKAQAEKTEYELQKMKRELLPSEEVETLWQKYISNIRSKILLLPNKVSRDLKGLEDEKEIEQIIENEVFNSLTGLSKGECIEED